MISVQSLSDQMKGYDSMKYIIKAVGADEWEWAGNGLKEARENLQRIRRNDPCGIYAIYRLDSKKGCYVRA